jgi:hypothetical protein
MMRTLATAAIAAGLLYSMTAGASAHYSSVPGGYGYYGHGPRAAERFYQCQHFTSNSGCCPIGYSWYPGIFSGYCGWHVMGLPWNR